MTGARTHSQKGKLPPGFSWSATLVVRIAASVTVPRGWHRGIACFRPKCTQHQIWRTHVGADMAPAVSGVEGTLTLYTSWSPGPCFPALHFLEFGFVGDRCPTLSAGGCTELLENLWCGRRLFLRCSRLRP